MNADQANRIRRVVYGTIGVIAVALLVGFTWIHWIAGAIVLALYAVLSIPLWAPQPVARAALRTFAFVFAAGSLAAMVAALLEGDVHHKFASGAVVCVAFLIYAVRGRIPDWLPHALGAPPLPKIEPPPMPANMPGEHRGAPDGR